MFGKLSIFAILLPLVKALQLATPSGVSSGGPVTITWTNDPGDPPTFSIYLVNTEEFHDSYAIANNVIPASGTISLTIPLVPTGAGYTLRAVNIGDINQVYAETGAFSIAGTSSTTSASGTSSGSATTATRPATTTTTGFGTTVPGTRTAAPTTGTTTGTAAPAFSSIGAAMTTRLATSGVFGSFATLVLGAAAGVAVCFL